LGKLGWISEIYWIRQTTEDPAELQRKKDEKNERRRRQGFDVVEDEDEEDEDDDDDDLAPGDPRLGANDWGASSKEGTGSAWEKRLELHKKKSWWGKVFEK